MKEFNGKSVFLWFVIVVLALVLLLGCPVLFLSIVISLLVLSGFILFLAWIMDIFK